MTERVVYIPLPLYLHTIFRKRKAQFGFLNSICAIA